MAQSESGASVGHRYWTRYYLEGLVDLDRLTHRYEFTDGLVIHLRNLIDKATNTTLCQLVADAECFADSAPEALEKTRYVVEGMVAIVSLATSAMTGIPQPQRVLDITPDVASRTLLQYLPWPGKARPMRKLDTDSFTLVWNRLMRKHPRELEKVARAMRWLRKSLLESDNLDRFSALWTGLESLNAQAIVLHDLKSDRTRLLKCPECGHSFADMPPATGMQYLVESTPGIPNDTWSRAKKLRNSLLHGGEVDAARRAAPTLSPGLHKALIWGMLDVLEVPEAERSRLLSAPLKLPESPYIRIEAVLEGLPTEAITDGKVNPEFVVVEQECSETRHEEGPRVETSRLAFKLEGCGDYKCPHRIVAMDVITRSTK